MPQTIKMSDKSNFDSNTIDEDTVRFFIWSVWNFFQSTTKIEPVIEPPYLLDEFQHQDYTGIIGVSGSQKGTVNFTVSQDILDEVLVINYPELAEKLFSEEELEEMRVDYAGEIANIVSGNARNYLGENFLISVPVVVTTPGEQIGLKGGSQGIVFPITWREKKCSLILNLEQNENDQSEDLSDIYEIV